MLKFYTFLLDLIFPITCQSCGVEGEWLCENCFQDLQFNISGQATLQKVKYFDKFWVVAEYDQDLLSSILHIFKYKYVESVGDFFSKIAVNFLKELQDVEFDYIVPVPLSKKRQLLRGYNQSEIIARNISNEFDWKLSINELIRKKHVHTQVGLDSQQRLKNVRNIFKIVDHIKFNNKKILLIDDVTTTGATMRECAKTLRKSGAKEVYGLVIFRS